MFGECWGNAMASEVLVKCVSCQRCCTSVTFCLRRQGNELANAGSDGSTGPLQLCVTGGQLHQLLCLCRLSLAPVTPVTNAELAMSFSLLLPRLLPG